MSIEELATMLGEQIMAEKASAWDEGFVFAAMWLDPEDHQHKNPYRLKVSA